MRGRRRARPCGRPRRPVHARPPRVALSRPHARGPEGPARHRTRERDAAPRKLAAGGGSDGARRLARPRARADGRQGARGARLVIHHREQQQRLQEKLRRELGLNVLTALRDPDVTEVMLNPDGSLWVESQRDGQLDTGARMSGIQAENLIGTVASMLGTVVNAGSPIVEGELPLDGNRFEGILPPVSTAPVFVIRKRPSAVYTLDDYVATGIMEPWQAEALRESIRTRQNIVIAGGAASGKTTLANALIHEMVVLGGQSERFVILEDTRELQCTARNAVQLRTGDVADLAHLTRVTMRLRPDRIVIGEVRGAEALALLKAWNTGQPGGLTTVHANGAAAALVRLDALIQEAGVPPQPQLVVEAVDLLVFITRTAEGRRVRDLAAVTGCDATSGYRLESLTSASKGGFARGEAFAPSPPPSFSRLSPASFRMPRRRRCCLPCQGTDPPSR